MESARTKLPGFGLPINYYQQYGDSFAFPTLANQLGVEPDGTILGLTTLREIIMLNIMNILTDEPDWRTTVFSDSDTNNWKCEVLKMPWKAISRPMMDWVIDELRYKAKLYEDIGASTPATLSKSDTVVPESLKLELQTAVARLEDVPNRHRGWHPGSNGQVLDLVDPSLFPLVYGRTRVLEPGRTSLENCIARCGEGRTIQIPTWDETSAVNDNCEPYYDYEGIPYSHKFQWLPCMVDTSGECSKITSYINNLHPVKHKDLYRLIEHIIDAAIPLWNLTLGPPQFCEWSKYLRIHYYQGYGESIQQPEPGTFKPPARPDPTLDLKGSKDFENNLQIIVKLANIHLTPENPSYEGKLWHLEGHLNEHICATALYYYSNENIEADTLVFRQQSATQAASALHYSWQFGDWLPAVFGCEATGPGVQVVGSVATHEGRLITFPNFLQHRVPPFSLVDRTRPGHQKILALFLVDPHLPILSTANVPCQQRDWWRDYTAQLGTGLDRLPVELQDTIFNEVADAFPFGLDEAKGFRLSLMDERKTFAIRQDEWFNASEFSL